MIGITDIIEKAGGIDAFTDQFVGRQKTIRAAKSHGTFEEVCRAEPRVKRLYERIPVIMRQGHFWGQWSKIKMEFSRIVGWEAANPVFCSGEDYDIVYRACYERAEASANPDEF